MNNENFFKFFSLDRLSYRASWGARSTFLIFSLNRLSYRASWGARSSFLIFFLSIVYRFERVEVPDRQLNSFSQSFIVTSELRCPVELFTFFLSIVYRIERFELPRRILSIYFIILHDPPKYLPEKRCKIISF